MDGTYGIASERPQHVAGGENDDVVFTSELPCNPIRTPIMLDHPAIHPFIRPFVA